MFALIIQKDVKLQGFLALSIAGTMYHGYFFAFHLLNIVNNNQLLSGVIKAVTQNGKTLLSLLTCFIYCL